MEAYVEKAIDSIRNARGELIKNDSSEIDPRVRAIVITKLDEAELWIQKIYRLAPEAPLTN